MTELTYYQRNRDVILNRTKDYYENDKEILREQARDKYKNLSKEEKNKKREYGRNRYHNMSKKILKNYREIKNIIKEFDFFSFHCVKHGTRSTVFQIKWHY